MDSLLCVLLLLDILIGTVQGFLEPWRVAACPQHCLCQLRNSSQLGTKLRTLDCSNRNLKSVPSGIPAEVESLLLQGNSLKSIPDRVLGLSTLKELDLSYNSISDLGSAPLFVNLTSLQHLNLDNNKLHSVAQGTFTGLKSLARLSLASNHIDGLEPHSFAGLDHLVFLSLQRNSLRRLLRSWFAGLVDLDTLLLDHNELSSVEDKTFEPLISLSELSLMENKLQHLFNTIFRGLDRLQILRLDSNMFDKVPSKAFAYFEGLRTLSMDENPITKLDAGAFEELYIGEITLCNMPNLLYVDKGAFSGLPDLTLLQIHDNPLLQYLDPEAFQDVPNLQYLYVHNNALRALPPALPQAFPLLREVTFHNNPIQCDCNVYWIKSLLHSQQQLQLQKETTAARKGGERIAESENHPTPSKMVGNGPDAANKDAEAETLSQGKTASSGFSPDSHRINTGVRPRGNNGPNNRTNRVSFTDADQFTCDSPAELNGRLLSSVPLANISASCPPTVIPFFNESYQRELGDGVTLECRGIGVPFPHIHWILANRKVVNNTSNDSRVRLSTMGALIVKHLKVIDAGTYTCVATNDLGYDTAMTQLRIHSKDVHILHKGVATNFITVTWNGTYSTVHTTDYLLLYRRSGTQEPYGKIRLQPYMRTYTITNLTPETLYEFCIAYDHEGEIVKLNCLNIKTKHQMIIVPRLTTLGSMSVLVALCTTIAFIVLSCLGIALIRRWRRRKAYKEPEGVNSYLGGSGLGMGPARGVNVGAGPSSAEDSKRVDSLSHIPLDNLYRPPSTPLCTSRTSLISHSNA